MADWHFDDGKYFDASENAVIEAEAELELDFRTVYRPFLNLEITAEAEIELDLTHAVSLDLLRLIPEWHHTQPALTEFVDEVELEVGSWQTSVRDAVKLNNPYVVADREYLKNIAYLIGLNLPPEDDSTEDEIRRNIVQAVDWYKLKGTYKSIDVIALIQKFSVNIYDMYTNDYETFVLQDWFVGGEDENPPGLDSSYYKSPHFGIEVLLNRVYSADSGSGSGGSGGGSVIVTSDSGQGGSTSNLWLSSYLDNFASLVEVTRPVHTVPHYILTLIPKTDEFGHVIEVSGDIETRVFSDWQFTTKYFDISGIEFDDGEIFDSSLTTFINSITTWYLGTGEGDINLDSWTPVTPVLTGTIDTDDITVDDEKITFSFIVPKAIAQDGIRELALYTNSGKLVVGSTFPRIDLDARVEMKVSVEVYKTDLS